jgi:enoyl-CoA hydratase/carnithine racemase
MMSELHDCVEELANWESGAALIVTGCREEGFFCAGADLKVVVQRLVRL